MSVKNRKKRLIPYLSSFFSDIVIEKTTSQYNYPLEVLLYNGKYMLNSPHATYSYEDKYSSYKDALDRIKPELKTVNSVLILGLGLGSIAQMLQKIHHVNGPIDCVEFDNIIIQLAEKYYPTKNDFSQLNIHHSDALEWILENVKQFDLITVDLFIDKRVPEQFHDEQFLEVLKKALSSKGILLFSTLKENYFTETVLHENLQKVFSGGYNIDTGGNLIYCYKSINK